MGRPGSRVRSTAQERAGAVPITRNGVSWGPPGDRGLPGLPGLPGDKAVPVVRNESASRDSRETGVVPWVRPTVPRRWNGSCSVPGHGNGPGSVSRRWNGRVSRVGRGPIYKPHSPPPRTGRRNNQLPGAPAAPSGKATWGVCVPWGICVLSFRDFVFFEWLFTRTILLCNSSTILLCHPTFPENRILLEKVPKPPKNASLGGFGNLFE